MVPKLASAALLLLGLGGCQHHASSCMGTFFFDAIAYPELRRDAYEIILQFDELEETVYADPVISSPTRLVIRGSGDACMRFGHSFVSSEMDEFRGLRFEGN